MTDLRAQHRMLSREDGVITIVELIVGMTITAILAGVAYAGFSSAKLAAQNNAMRAIAAQVDSSIATFNRMYPVQPNPTTGVLEDPLVTRLGSSGIDAAGDRRTGYFTPMGDPLLKTWPMNPYPGPQRRIRIRGYGTADVCPTSLPDGNIAICRSVDADGGWELRYFGRETRGANKGSAKQLGRRRNGIEQ